MSGWGDRGQPQLSELQGPELAVLLRPIFRAQDGQVVEGRFRLGRRRRFGRETFHDQVALMLLEHNRGQTEVNPVLPEFDLRQVEGIEAQFEGTARQVWLDLIAIALQREGRIFADVAFLAPQKGPADGFGIGVADLIQTGRVTRERRLVRLTVDMLVIHTLQPGPQRFVESPSRC